MNCIAPRRPALRYHGGKHRLAAWIVGHFPPHRVYVEPFGGAASVLLRKTCSHAEIYNDLDDDVVNLFRVLRSPELSARLVQAVELTPFARVEFVEATELSSDPVERARRLVIRSFMGYGSNGHNISIRTGFRNHSHRSGSTPAVDWSRMPKALVDVARRFAAVVIEHRPAIHVMRQHDGPDTLHYADPPYVHATRTSRLHGRRDYHGYTHEMDDAGHAELLGVLRDLRGMVVVSGYRTALYDDGLRGWTRVEREVRIVSGQTRRECLWLSPRTVAASAGRDLLGGA